jgi:hypothetical protein
VVFRHVGELSFSLAKIVIKAPTTGFTCPVRGGYIYTSLESEMSDRVSDSDLLRHRFEPEWAQRIPLRRQSSTSSSNSDANKDEGYDGMDDEDDDDDDEENGRIDDQEDEEAQYLNDYFPFEYVPTRRRLRGPPLTVHANMDDAEVVGDGDVKVRAHFSVNPDLSRCEIVFDPPCAARYILIKFVGSSPMVNIDVQAVLGYGFVGFRSFPTVVAR